MGDARIYELREFLLSADEVIHHLVGDVCELQDFALLVISDEYHHLYLVIDLVFIYKLTTATTT